MGSKSEPPLPPPIGRVVSAFLKTCFKSEEFQYAQIDGRVEAQAAFVRTDGGIHLNAVAAVDLDLSFVVHPSDAEHNDALGFDDALKQVLLGVISDFLPKTDPSS